MRAALAFLLDPPRCHAFDASSLALPNATTTLVTLDGEVYDTDSMHFHVDQRRPVHVHHGRTLRSWLPVTLDSRTAITQFDMMARLDAAGASGGGTSLRTQPWESGGSLKTSELQFRRFFYAVDYVELFAAQRPGHRATCRRSRWAPWFKRGGWAFSLPLDSPGSFLEIANLVEFSISPNR